MHASSQPPPRYTTLTQLITEYATVTELSRDLDYAMLCLLLLTKYEEEQTKSIINAYQTLYEIKHLIQAQPTITKP